MTNRHLSDIDAEMAVIGSCLISPDALTRVISAGLQPEDFSQNNHTFLWAAMCEMHANSMSCDAITIGDHLGKTRKGHASELVSYAIELASNTPGSANAEAYADIVMECATARKVFKAGQQIAALSEKGTDALVEANKLIQQIQPMKAETLTTISSCGNEFLDELQARYEKGNTSRVKTGIAAIDKFLGGGLEPALYILAARPSMGKSSMALQILLDIAVNQKKRALFFSLEMPRRIVMERAVAHLSRVPFDRIRDPKPIWDGNTQIGGMLDDDWPKVTSCMSRIKGSPLIISDGAAQSPAKIIAQAQRSHQKEPLSCIVVDYTLLMNFGNAKSEQEMRQALSNSLKMFVALYKELKIPVVLLHQLNRANESRSDKRPLMSDLAATGAIEQDADCIIFPHREGYYESGGASSSGLAEIIFAKNRNGSTGTVPLDWQGQYQNFGEWKGQWPIKKQQETRKSVYDDTAKGKRY